MKASMCLLLFIAALAWAEAPSKGYSLYLEGRHEEALAWYRAVPGGELDRARILEELDRGQEALDLLESALRASPEDPLLRSELAWLLLRRGEKRRALRTFREALEQDTSRPQELLGLGWALLESRSYPEAVERLKAYDKARPRSALARFLLGKAHEGEGSTREAIKAYTRAIQADAYFLEARLPLAALYEKSREVEKAWRNYAKVVQTDPTNAQARTGRDRLEARLVRKPEEILPPKLIAKHSTVEPGPGRERSPLLRVGIGTGLSGRSMPRKAASFRSSVPFEVLDSRTGKLKARGSAKETWSVVLDEDRLSLKDAKGKVVLALQEGVRIRPKRAGKSTLILGGLSYAPGYSWGGISERELRGEVEFLPDAKRKTLRIVNLLNLEEYLYGVLNSEMPGHWPKEALKAQAVVARSQALYRRQVSRPHGKDYDLCDEQHCQVYGGVAAESRAARSAVDATRGETLFYGRKPAHTIFYSNCGGLTASGAGIGWSDLPYWSSVSDLRTGGKAPSSPWELRQWLRGAPSAYCGKGHTPSAAFRWVRLIHARDLESRLRGKAKIGRLRAVITIRRGGSGRINALLLRGAGGNLVLEKEHEIRRLMGMGALRSTLFAIEPFMKDGALDSLLLYGGGWGHGVGLCQAGAGGRADAGASYREILRHYYPGATLRTP